MKKLTLLLTTIVIVASPVLAADAKQSDDCQKTHHKHHAKHHEVTNTQECNYIHNNFNGPYLGAALGLGSNLGKQKENLTQAGNSTLNLSGRNARAGILGGLNAGWNWRLPCNMSGNWLVGLDLFADAANVKSSHTINSTDVNNVNINFKTTMKWGFGAGAKFGVIANNVLYYTSAHWVGSQFKLNAHFTSTKPPAVNASANKKKFASGIRIGLGMEAPINEHVNLGIEGGYSWYKVINATTTIIQAGSANEIIKFSNKPTIIDIKAKISWAFKGIA